MVMMTTTRVMTVTMDYNEKSSYFRQRTKNRLTTLLYCDDKNRTGDAVLRNYRALSHQCGVLVGGDALQPEQSFPRRLRRVR